MILAALDWMLFRPRSLRPYLNIGIPFLIGHLIGWALSWWFT